MPSMSSLLTFSRWTPSGQLSGDDHHGKGGGSGVCKKAHRDLKEAAKECRARREAVAELYCCSNSEQPEVDWREVKGKDRWSIWAWLVFLVGD